ncbi:MAG: hypothetical protein GWN07_41520, partial [Actinobacteria bacterium]|nr:hypothetical protein [Actinomycetota bacterium]NIS37512.1 hypothetical protein [Actinomycetota bacterium]NIU71578.1 hypothetical protein [Actinomycetota bacterium]NIW33528.1 hypothetical protein [Actinomycetota bacterium]NIX25953.1 hypothetical protein [Actinomycetota bacterium]
MVDDTVAGGGAISMAEGSSIDAGSGHVDIDADEDVTVSSVVTTSTTSTPATSAVDIKSVSGNIFDAQDDLVADVTTGANGKVS